MSLAKRTKLGQERNIPKIHNHAQAKGLFRGLHAHDPSIMSS